jgi:hypothetical protein
VFFSKQNIFLKKKGKIYKNIHVSNKDLSKIKPPLDNL